MSDRTFRCRVVTPSQSLLDEPVEYANVPMWDGLMGFQHGRSPLVGKLGLGELRLRFPAGTHGGADRTFFIAIQLLDSPRIVWPVIPRTLAGHRPP